MLDEYFNLLLKLKPEQQNFRLVFLASQYYYQLSSRNLMRKDIFYKVGFAKYFDTSLTRFNDLVKKHEGENMT